jgi:hypothetical protein
MAERPTKRSKTQTPDVVVWKGVFLATAEALAVLCAICQLRIQSGSFYFSRDRLSATRIPLLLGEEGHRIVCVRAATQGHVDAIQHQLSSWLCASEVTELSPYLDAIVPPGLASIITHYAVGPICFDEAEMLFQKKALLSFIQFGLDWGGQACAMPPTIDYDATEARMVAEFNNNLIGQADFHAMDDCFHTNLHDHWRSMDVASFVQDANSILSQ